MVMYGTTHQVHTPSRSSDGQSLLSDNAFILARWSVHFQSLFSANRNVHNTAIHRIGFWLGIALIGFSALFVIDVTSGNPIHLRHL